ncbi:hypothetical protein NX059_008708 [Plenodomus lindquistii]|nr:hypothetical protein NX059_008708 [Plenodomus lindquistii]
MANAVCARDGERLTSSAAKTFSSDFRVAAILPPPAGSTTAKLRPIMSPRCQLLAGRFSANALAIRTAQSSQRTYATTTTSVIPEPVVKNPLKRRKGGDLGSHLPKNIIPKDAYIPAYPYGEYQLYRQANKGLYGEQMIQFGNNVSKRTETKTRRVWAPNVLSKSLYSVALKKKIKLRITAAVLKTIDREGGLDEYLLKDSPHRIKELGPMGWALRWTLMQTPEVITRLRDEAAALGIDQETIDKQWPTPKMAYDASIAQDSSTEAPAYNFEADTSTAAEEQGMWDPEDTTSPPLRQSDSEEKATAIAAMVEYSKALFAADRYVARNTVDTPEAGIKLAFIRAPERAAITERKREQFKAKLAVFTSQELDDLKKRLELPADISEYQLRNIALHQQRREQINELGSKEAWEKMKQKTYEERRDAANLKPQWTPEEKKAQYKKLIHEAETAVMNKTLDEERRAFFVEAMKKAEWAIKAKAGKGKTEYVRWVLEEKFGKESLEFRRSGRGKGNDLNALKGGEGEDGWKQVVGASQESEAGKSRPSI